MKSLRFITGSTSVKRYKSIDDILLYNWRKCNEGSFGYVRLEPTEDYNTEDLTCFESLQDQIIDTYGEPDIVERYRNLRAKKAIALCNWIIEGRDFYLNEIRYYENKINDLTKELGGGISISDALIYISRDLAGGRPIDEREITLKKYLDYLKVYERSSKKK